MDLSRIEALKEKVFAQSNTHCFIERERYLAAFSPEEDKPFDYYPKMLAGMLDYVSTPVEPEDHFAGRVVEGPPEGNAPNRIFYAKGHLTPDYPRLLQYGYRGILEKIKENAAKIGTKEAENYAKNAEICINAIRRFALRYAEAAKQAGKERIAEALSRVPFEPAYDLFSALQSVWFMHMIASCYVGYRDYGFGYMDEYLYPYYLIEKEKSTPDEIREMLAGFFIKPNEICGRGTHNYKQKPVLCQASKQYVLLDGGRANELTELMLEAAEINSMAQPEITVILAQNAPDAFKKKVFSAMAAMTDKLQIYNYDLLRGFLQSKGLPREIVDHPAFTACCTGDIYLHSCREEFYLPTVQTFCKVLFEGKFSSKEALLAAYSTAITQEAEAYIVESRDPGSDWARMAYVLDSLLLSSCNERCQYAPYGLKYRGKNIFLPGLATLGDSLCALDTLVFQGEMDYSEFIEILKKDFEGNELFSSRLAALPKFGNDLAADRYTAEMADLLVTAVENAAHRPEEILLPSFYSLQRDNEWASEIPATPDGRRAGTPISENQSPVYGADQQGITALLNSLAKMPFGRTAAGGLNLTFSAAIKPEILRALAETYFQKGGLHMGITVLDHATLREAMAHPEKYRSLTVRLYGFSEYFIALPEWQQQAVLNRTVY
ncbi:MAG: hypothetical protein IJ043_04850 [Clostridia bacterium]|nr:hypothetical protein [Clostridia bacterium]